jgi:hypothetical protein
MTDPAGGLAPADRDALLRWRLALGPEVERASGAMGLDGLAGAPRALGLAPGDLQEARRRSTSRTARGPADRRRPYVPVAVGDPAVLRQRDGRADAEGRHRAQGVTAAVQRDDARCSKNVELVSLLMGAGA